MIVKASQVEDSSWSKEIVDAGLLDKFCLGIGNALKIGQDYPGLQHYGIEDEMVTYKRRIYIPDCKWGPNLFRVEYYPEVMF